MKCKNCVEEVDSNFCANCGQAVNLKRINGHYIVHEIEHVLHLERGILYTVKELLIRPGKSVKHFITDNRNRLVKPIIFIIVSSLIYSVISHFFHIEDEYVKFQDTKESTTKQIFEWIQGHYGYANIIMGVFIAFWTRLFFRKYDFNFFEILILLCYVMGTGMLIYAVFAIFQGLTHIHSMTAAGVVGFIYLTWAIGQFFDKKKIASYAKAIAAYFLGMLSFTLIAVLIGFAIDSIFALR